MEALAGLQFFAVAGRVEQIAVALAKGVVDLGDDGAQAAILAVGVPETHGFEGVAQHARVGVQPNFSVCIVHAFALQKVHEPGQRPPLFWPASVAMVAIEKADGASAVDGQTPGGGCLAYASHGQHQKEVVIDKFIPTGAQACVPHLAKTNLSDRCLAHATALRACSVAVSRASAAARPDLRPSS